jgi:hypothetical protein
MLIHALSDFAHLLLVQSDFYCCTSLATNEPRTKRAATFRKFLNCCYAGVMENDDELLKI